jgi:hypothetical protein
MNRSSSLIQRGLIGGLWGTFAMSLLMGAATASGVSPLPRPVPAALAGMLLGAVAKPILMLTALLLHFGIGGASGALLAAWRERITYRNALGLALALWLIMQLAVFPLLGWGVFGAAVTPKLAVATLVPHLAYGGVLGWYGRRLPEAVPA